MTHIENHADTHVNIIGTIDAMCRYYLNIHRYYLNIHMMSSRCTPRRDICYLDTMYLNIHMIDTIYLNMHMMSSRCTPRHDICYPYDVSEYTHDRHDIPEYTHDVI